VTHGAGWLPRLGAHAFPAACCTQVVAAQKPLGLSSSPHTKASVTITGGTGGLGMLMAKWMAGSGEVARIRLVSRTGRCVYAASTAPAPLGKAGGCAHQLLCMHAQLFSAQGPVHAAASSDRRPLNFTHPLLQAGQQ